MWLTFLAVVTFDDDDNNVEAVLLLSVTSLLLLDVDLTIIGFVNLCCSDETIS
jgi:hypothetical protein